MNARSALILVGLLVLTGPSRQQEDDPPNDISSSRLSQEYPNGKSELVFLMDRSGSIGARDFGVQVSFVKDLLTKFGIGNDATRVAVVSYSDDVTRHIDYIGGQTGNKCQFLSDMKAVKYVDGSSTDTALALTEARHIFVNSRPDVKKALILLGDGVANTGIDPEAVAGQLKAEGVEIFTIGVGLQDRTQLRQIASSWQHYFSYHSFEDFERLALRIRGDQHESLYDTVNQTLCDSLCHQPFPEAGYGCCDLTAKCMCSLVGGRHDCVCGPGTYGRNGFLYQCKLCPRGTYKSTYEPTDGCTPCPTDSTTTAEGTETLGACACKEGYEGDPLSGVPCELVRCPRLQSPNHGRIIPPNCGYKYQSVCSFDCDIGFELVDETSAKRRCKADGYWTGTTPQCRKVQCRELAKPRHGSMECRNQETGGRSVYNTICRFTCDDGYNPVGNRERTCTETGEWSGSNFTCRAITCPLLPPLRHGTFEPSSCANTRQRVKLHCVFKCKQEFRLVGPPSKICEASGNWSRPEEDVACVDDVPPTITCPRSVVDEADPGLSTADVSWDMPVVTDNLDGTDALTVQVSPIGMQSPHRFEIGYQVITYTVTDRAGLSKSCAFKVVIRDTQLPTVDTCPGPILDIVSKDKITPVNWEEPEFADNSKQTLKMVASHESGAELVWGTHIVTYTATDTGGNSAECRFTVRVGPSSCPNHPDPRNGARACDQWLFGQFCRVYCNEAYEFAEKPADWYICSRGNWKSQPSRYSIPWPDCSEKAPLNGVRLGMKSQYYAGDCVDGKAQKAIKAAFVQDFSESIFNKHGACLRENACLVDYVTVYCGEIDDLQRRKKRSSDGLNDGAQLANVITLDFTLSVRIQYTNQTQHNNQLANAVHTLEEIGHDYERLAHIGQLQLVVGNQTLPVVKDSVEINQTVPFCRNGAVLLGHSKCINCAVGWYLDNDRQACRVCPQGTYQDDEGQDHCKTCPSGTWTEGDQTKDRRECRPECRPGTFSPSGLATCQPCPQGLFQPSFKQTSCYPCEAGTTTATKGSRSVFDCQVVCSPGTFSVTGLRPCRSCPLGSYQPEEQHTSCIPCPGVTTTAVHGATSDEQCEEINACDSAPCQNGAQCTSGRGTLHCQCVSGFAGTTCEIDMDECQSQPCLFGATCVDGVGGVDCVCTHGYEGALCGTEINECLSNPCQNEARCQDQIAGFECDCVDGFWGSLCENEPDPCAVGEVCLNGAFCIPTPRSFRCVCMPGFHGARCEVDVDECDLQPCLNEARCENTQGSFHCVCVDGFEGMHCELNIDDCLHHACANGSTCHDVIADYQCLCPPGITGRFCETEMSEDFLLSFDRSLMSDFSLVRTSHPQFQAVTVSMWLRTLDSVNIGTPISYAAWRPANDSTGEGHLVDNALTLTDCASLKIYVNGMITFTDVAVNNGYWNNLVFTWQVSGEWHMYLNGSGVGSGVGSGAEMSAEAIPGRGVFVLGQEQDSLGGAFSSRETYLGDLYKINIWDRVLEEDEIQSIPGGCFTVKGNVVAWSDFSAGIPKDSGLVPQLTNATVQMPNCTSF